MSDTRPKHILILMLAIPAVLCAQPQRETRGGALMSFSAEKQLIRNLDLNFEEELRLATTPNVYDRTVSTLGIDYSLMNKKLKIGAYYAFIYLYNNDFLYEPRHRFYVNLSYRQKLDQLTLSWRIRLQETLRDDNRGSYRVNPRYVMKNKLEAEYAIFGKPWKPFISCDFSTNLNDDETRYDLVRLRTQAGANWRINRTTSMDFYLRYDEYLKADDPRTISVGVAYKMRF
ncbi:MAG: DUF2490 domain-containing protein [Tannerella sp.]|jgi:hypothetical protein|nr:DUF2490 domain-containing protein [Tannerella sp.]